MASGSLLYLGWPTMIGDGEQCRRCKHAIWEGKQKMPWCRSFPFPQVIPEEILCGWDHRNPHPQDNGLRWEPREPGMTHPSELSEEVPAGK